MSSVMLPSARLWRWVAPFVMLALLLLPVLHTGPYLLLEAPAPDSPPLERPDEVPAPAAGYLMVVIDGMRADYLTNPEYMPKMASLAQDSAVLDVTTGPLTMTGFCTREMATGVPSTPVDAMRNWYVVPTGVDDGYTLAQSHGYQVGFTGFFVWESLYPDEEGSWVHQTVYDSGFTDVYEADAQTFDNVHAWLDNGSVDVLVAHVVGVDHAAHLYGLEEQEYADKLTSLDLDLNLLVASVPDDWVVVITSDHGTTIDGRHGSGEEETRSVKAIVTGPGVLSGATEDVRQRDLASLPYMFLDLPHPIAGDVRMPISILDQAVWGQDGITAIELWNWQAAVSRQQWLVATDNPGVTGLDPQEVNWNALPDDILGMRNSDVALGVTVSVLVVILAWAMIGSPSLRGPGERRLLTFLTVTMAGMVALVYYSELTIRYARMVGAAGSMGLLLLSWIFSQSYSEGKEGLRKRLSEWFSTWPWYTPYALLGLIAWYPQTRFGPTMLLLPILLWMAYRQDRDKNWSDQGRWAVWLLAIGALWMTIGSHGRSDPSMQWGRVALLAFQPDASFISMASLSCIALLFVSAWLTRWLKSDDSPIERLLLGALLSVFVWVDYLATSDMDRVALVVLLVIGILAGLQSSGKLPETFLGNRVPGWLPELFVGGTLALTWGAWPAAVTLCMAACVQRAIEEPLSWISQKDGPPQIRAWRFCLMVTFPMALWMLLWAFFGQVEMMHPRELDPAHWFVRAGYVGARTAPPVWWMMFISMAPVTLAFGHLFSAWGRAGLSLKPMGYYLLANLVGLSVSLWLSVNLPRLLFKITSESLIVVIVFFTALAVHYGLRRWSSRYPGPGEATA